MKKYWELAELENELFFSRPFWIFCFIPIKTCQSLLFSKDFSKFWWLPGFPAPNSTWLNICNTVYIHTFLYRQGETDKHITNECYELWHVTFLLPKGSAYTSKFSTMILRLLKAFFGLISSIFEGFWCSAQIAVLDSFMYVLFSYILTIRYSQGNVLTFTSQ